MDNLLKLLVLGVGLVGCAPRQVERFEVGRPQPLGASAADTAQKLTDRLIEQKDAITTCVDRYDERIALEGPLDVDLTLLVRDSSVIVSDVAPRSTSTAVDSTLVACLRSLTKTWKLEGEDTVVKLPLLATPHKRAAPSIADGQQVQSSTSASRSGFRPAE
jgi:hypothetical protein